MKRREVFLLTKTKTEKGEVMQDLLDAKGGEMKIENPIISSSRICPICGEQMEQKTKKVDGAWGNTRTKVYFKCLNPECYYEEGAGLSPSPTFG